MPIDLLKDRVQPGDLLSDRVAPTAQEQPSTLSDMGQSLLSGLRSAGEGIAGSFGDVNAINGKIAGWVAKELGASPDTQATVAKYGRYLSPTAIFPTTQEVQNTVTDPAFGSSYQPQTVPGQYMH